MLKISSKRLEIEIPHPGEAPNNTYRFDRAGYISSILLDGKYSFCVSEPTNLVHPSSGGQGLCNEFKFDIACDEVVSGERFPKFGIGLFLKPDENPYCFFHQYDVTPFSIDCECKQNTIVFHTQPILCSGYALKHTKTITVDDNIIKMNVMLENTGAKEIVMQEYCHNFLTIDNLPLGPDYRIDIPGVSDRGTEVLTGTIKGDGNGYTFSDYNPKAAMVEVKEDELFDLTPFSWKMSNQKSSAFIEVSEYFKPAGLAMWAIDHIISLEVFKGIRLQPGQTHEWLRTWLFDTSID